MCFGDNPGCNCCKSLPVWRTLLGPFTVRTNTTGWIDTQGSLTWDGGMISATDTADEKATSSGGIQAKTADVFYSIDANQPIRKIVQYRCDSPTRIWESDLPAWWLNPGELRSLSAGSHGFIGWHPNTSSQSVSGNLLWIDKGGNWVYAPKQADDEIEVVGHGLFDTTTSAYDGGEYGDFNVHFSPNSPHVFFRYREQDGAGHHLHAIIGTFELVDVSGNWRLKITPIESWETINPFDGLALPTGSFGTGKDDELFWAVHVDEYFINSSEFKNVLLSANLPDWDYEHSTSTFVADARVKFWPDNLMFYRYTHNDPAVTENTTFGVHSFEGTEFETSFLETGSTLNYSGVDPNWGEGFSMYPIAGKWAVNFRVHHSESQTAYENLEILFPGIDHPEEMVYEEEYLQFGQDYETFEGWLDESLTRVFKPAIWNRWSIFDAAGIDDDWDRTVLAADSVTMNRRVYLVSEVLDGPATDAVVPLVGTTARYKLRFREQQPGPDLILYDYAGDDPELSDFTIYATGTVTHGTPVFTKVNDYRYDVDVPEVVGGEEGGQISVTVANPSELSTEDYVPLTGTPEILERYVVAAVPPV